jgi:hypothetical protein
VRRHYAETKAQRQAHWLSQFSDAVVTLDSKHAGRIEWSSALHFYHQGMTAGDAAQLYVSNRSDQAEKEYQDHLSDQDEEYEQRVRARYLSSGYPNIY